MLFSSVALAQTGTLAGKVVDGETGEELIGCTVFIKSLSKGASTDISGNFNFKVEPGTYNVEFSYITYQKKVVEDVTIKADEITKLDIALESDNKQMEEVVVSARRVDNNEVAFLRMQKRSISVQDGITSEEIGRVGFSNSAESMKQVTGASVEGGKYIVMRGLGDRYSISSMDGVVLPTTNPYRNSTSLDLIPTNMVDNIVVKKTFSPDLPGNFTGGAVDINSKSLPDRFYFKVKMSTSYNDQTTFGNGFLSDPINNNLSRLGYDDGSRALKNSWKSSSYLNQLNTYLIDIQNNSLSNSEIQAFNNAMRSFSGRSFTVQEATPGLDHSLSVTVGNRFSINDKQLGYYFGFNYGNSFTLYDDRQINNYTARIPTGSGTRMQEFQINQGTESKNEVDNGLIGQLTYQWNPKNELSILTLYNNNGTESVLNMENGRYPGALSSGTFNNRVISFKQRQLFNNQLKGRHNFEELDLNWSTNFVLSSQYEPDTRFLGAPVDDTGQYFFIREVQLPFHYFRDLKDTQYNGKVDVDYRLNDSFKLQAGGFYSRKERNFDEFRFQLENNGTDPSYNQFLSFREASGDYSNFFGTDNTGIIGTDGSGYPILGLTYRNQTRPQNSYSGFEQIAAFYLMGEYDVSDKLRIHGGARIEKTDFEVSSSEANAEVGSIDVLDVLPSLNFIYSLTDNSNLRLSGSRTLARPNMRELAPFSSFDLLGGFPVVGNQALNQSNIYNADLRYELFPNAGELIAISAFYKHFKNPIVLELDVASDQPQYQYINTNTGQLFGFEIELRKQLDFLSPSLKNFKFSSNFTYINSRVDLSDNEYNTRKKLDPNINSYRPFPYQSPYIANVTLSYSNPDIGWDGAVYANVFGPRLTSNGSGAAPDVYEVYGQLNEKNRITSQVPTPDLNFRVSKKLDNGFSASLSVSNILDYSKVEYQEDNGTYFTNSALNPGRTFKVSLSYEIR
jgi:hypothetical protein